ncbi:3-oxo-5-alpha-steroid 4-dehydrogenase 2 [Trichosurus vulpecula]|uniref:3-oxo-5-alpha-steroid 4-dehydrogenase 2 n=1 Tax=Trichosurus vulpecula TaxID=9337 RepID=UPI00186AEB47|nr:3-oxo-5-alpha-steroid 4-dehydrogenase 2 [Trichosurus vulpecula]
MLTMCQLNPVLAGSALLAGFGLHHLLLSSPCQYGKQDERPLPLSTQLPARVAWFLQELPSFLVPVGLLAWQPHPLFGPPGTLLLGLFCGHYFHRTFIYAPLTRGRPCPIDMLFFALVFCTLNGFLQGYYLIYCAEYPEEWFTDVRFTSGILLFFLGMAINIHSDYLLRQLRKPGEISYKIPQGGLFTYISGANYFGEIVEWIGYAMATWSPPGLAFAFFSLCFLGKRACQHHRFYLKKFQDYPKSRKALIPFIF